MFRDLLDILKDFLKKIISSRLLVLGVICIAMYAGLIHKLFNLQIVNGEQALNDYMQLTEQTLTTAGTRGNIYDRNGKVLAYNKLAYSVTVQDTGAYKTTADQNAMYLRLVRILEKHGETVQGKFEVALDSNGDMIYTSSSEAARKRFLRDYYGLKSVEELDDEDNKYPSAISARELFEKAFTTAKLNEMKDADGNPVTMTDQEALDIINIKYALRLMSYRKYEATTVATQVSDETVADVLEHTADLAGVNVEETTIRAYNDSIAFAPIIGYTGKVQEDQLEELKRAVRTMTSTILWERRGLKPRWSRSFREQREVRRSTRTAAGGSGRLSTRRNPRQAMISILHRSQGCRPVFTIWWNSLWPEFC